MGTHARTHTVIHTQIHRHLDGQTNNQTERERERDCVCMCVYVCQQCWVCAVDAAEQSTTSGGRLPIIRQKLRVHHGSSMSLNSTNKRNRSRELDLDLLQLDCLFVCLFVCLFICLFVYFFVCLFGGVSKAGEIRTLPKTSLPVAVLRVAKGRIP